MKEYNIKGVLKSLGLKLQALRREKEITARALSRLTKDKHPDGKVIQYARISRIENGRVVPNILELFVLASALGIEVGELFDASTPSTNPPKMEFLNIPEGAKVIVLCLK